MTDLGTNALSTRVTYALILFIACFIFCHANAFSQTDRDKDIRIVIFKDGTVIQGQVVQMNIDTITIWTPDDNIIVRKFADVEKFVKEDINPSHNPSRNGPQLDKTH
jgi:hypothetical protein